MGSYENNKIKLQAKSCVRLLHKTFLYNTAVYVIKKWQTTLRYLKIHWEADKKENKMKQKTNILNQENWIRLIAILAIQ